MTVVAHQQSPRWIMETRRVSSSSDLDIYFDAEDGNDSNRGSQNQPLQSLDRLFSLPLTGGETVYLKRGQRFIAPSSISDFVGDVTFRDWGINPGRPILEGTPRATGWINDSGNVWSAPVGSITSNATTEMAWIDDVEGTLKLSKPIEGDDPGTFWFDFANNLLWIRFADGLDPTTVIVNSASAAAGTLYRFKDSAGMLQNLELLNGPVTGAMMTGNFNTPQFDWVFHGCGWSQSRHHGWQDFFNLGGNVEMQDCDFVANAFIPMNAEKEHNGSSWHRCSFSDSTFDDTLSQGLFLVGENCRITNCDAFRNRGFGFILRENFNNNNLIEDCRAWENGNNHVDAGGFSIYDVGGTVLRRCLSWNNGRDADGTHGRGFNFDVGSDGIFVEDCEAWANQQSGFGFSVTSTERTLGIEMYNCSSRDNSHGSAVVPAGLLTYGAGDDTILTVTHCEFLNSHATAGSALALDLPTETGAGSNLTFDFNRYGDDRTHTNLVRWGGVSYVDLPAFQVGETQEANGVELRNP